MCPDQGRIATTRCAAVRCAPFFVCCYAAMLLCIGAIPWTFHQITSPILLLLLLCLATFALPKVARVSLHIIIGEAILLICLVDCYCQYKFGSTITPRILNLVIHTDAREAKEFFATFVGADILRCWRIVVILLLIIILPITCGRNTENQNNSVRDGFPVPENKNGKHINISTYQHFNILTIVLCVALLAYEVPSTVRFVHLIFSTKSQQESESSIFKGYRNDTATPLHRLIFSWHVNNQSKETLQAMKQSTFDAQIYENENASKAACVPTENFNLVLIIGESYNKHHSALYGYRLNTTPRQLKRMEDGELVLFTDAVSPWNLTNNVMMSLFSLYEQGDSAGMGEYPLFPILFRRAGYSVRFISNQFAFKGLHKSFTNKAGNFFLSDRELSDSLFDYRNERTAKYDMRILGSLRYAENGNGERNRKQGCLRTNGERNTLDIIHLQGQHFKYDKRYPHKLSHFTPNDYADRNIDEEARRTVMQYDNATFYNDMVVDSIIKHYENADAVIIYLSDHGEEVWDDDKTRGRTFKTPGQLEARNEYEVPLWIWCSAKYRERHPDIMEQIREAADRPLLTDAIPQMLLYLAGIQCKWYHDRQNPLSPNYRPKKRMIDGTVDYDEL